MCCCKPKWISTSRLSSFLVSFVRCMLLPRLDRGAGQCAGRHRMLPGWVERTRHRPVRTPSSSSEELLTDEAMARRRGRVRAPASAGGGSTTHVFRRRCSSCGSSDVNRSRIVGIGRANSLGPSVRLPSGNFQPPQVRKVGAGQQKPCAQKAFDSTLGYPGEGPGVQLCYAFKSSGKCKRGTNCPFCS